MVAVHPLLAETIPQPGHQGDHLIVPGMFIGGHGVVLLGVFVPPCAASHRTRSRPGTSATGSARGSFAPARPARRRRRRSALLARAPPPAAPECASSGGARVRASGAHYET